MSSDLFFSKVNKQTENGCWEWCGTLNPGGYGVFLGGKKAHRISWEIHNGAIPPGNHHGTTCVLHKCDNRKCVNPDHLFLGDAHDNMQDLISKDRNKHVRGENNWNAKLTESDIDAIHRAKERGATNRSIAKSFGVAQSTITRILNGEKWRHHADQWTGLDPAAQANLNQSALARFHAYKEELRKDGHKWDGDAEDILTGFIWYEIEDN